MSANHVIKISDPADRLDLSYAFANNYAALGRDPDPLKEMAEVGRDVADGHEARGALAHLAEIEPLVKLLTGTRVRAGVLLDFPDGMGGASTKAEQAKVAKAAGAAEADVVINLHAVQARDRETLLAEFGAVSQHLPAFKVITQIPYLWQFDRASVEWVMEVLAEAGAYCIKDWTTRDNFLLPDGATLDFQHETRLRYIEFMANYIRGHKLPLALKVAGRVTAENVKSFVDAGATLIGTSYRKAAALREALLA